MGKLVEKTHGRHSDTPRHAFTVLLSVMVTDQRKYSVKTAEFAKADLLCMPRRLRPFEALLLPLSGSLCPSQTLSSSIATAFSSIPKSSPRACRGELLTLAGYEISAEEIAETYAGLTFKDIMMRVEEKSSIPFQASLIDRAEDLVDRKLRSDVRAIDGAREAVAA